jgi:ADP-ribose pyrophosphatase YjhB (NUDIX family)
MPKFHISSGGVVFRAIRSAQSMGQEPVPGEKTSVPAEPRQAGAAGEEAVSAASGRAGEMAASGRAGVNARGVGGCAGEKESVSADSRVAGCYEVALIRVMRAGGESAWALPKGWVEQGEEPEQTAIREVREETGLNTRVLKKIDEISYQFYSRADHDRVSKTVHLFLLECLGGNTADHDTEVEEARWFPIEEAGQWLTYKNEREALGKAAFLLEGEYHT